MKLKKNIRRIIALLMLLLLFCTNVSNNCFTGSNVDLNNIKFKLPQKKIGSTNYLENNGVYFIRSKINPNRVVDVPNANYVENNNLIVFTGTYWGNQRFVLEKSFNNTYRIKPLDCNRLYFAVDNNNSNENNKIILKKENDYNKKNILLTDRFKIEYVSSHGTFVIKTAVSNYSKYIALQDCEDKNNNKLIQKSYSDSNYQYFEWIFERTDTLGINCNHAETYTPNSSKTFLLNMQYSVKYYVELVYPTTINCKLTLFKDDGKGTIITEISSNGTGNIKVLCNSEAFITIGVKVSNLSNQSVNMTVKVYPEKSYSVTTMFDVGKNDIDSISIPLDTIPYATSKGYYPIFQSNMHRDNILEVGPNGKKYINSDLYFDIHHGNPGGTCFYEGVEENGGWIDIVNMPSFNGTKFTYWGSCKSATNSSNHNNSGISSSLAKKAVSNGAQYSLGYPGDVYSRASRDFVLYFWEKYKDSNNIMECCKYALDCVSNKHWGLEMIGMFNATWHPSLFYVHEGAITEVDVSGITVYSNKSASLNQCNTSNVNDNSFYIESAGQRYIKYNGLMTNILYSEENLEQLNELLKNKIYPINNQSKFLIYYNNKFFEYSINDTSIEEQIFFNVTLNKYVSGDEFALYSQLKERIVTEL